MVVQPIFNQRSGPSRKRWAIIPPLWNLFLTVWSKTCTPAVCSYVGLRPCFNCFYNETDTDPAAKCDLVPFYSLIVDKDWDSAWRKVLQVCAIARGSRDHVNNQRWFSQSVKQVGRQESSNEDRKEDKCAGEKIERHNDEGCLAVVSTFHFVFHITKPVKSIQLLTLWFMGFFVTFN